MKKIVKILMFLFIGIIIVSCSGEKDEPDEPYNKDENGNYIKERLILIYAVAANSLQSNLSYDLDEIIKAAEGKNGSEPLNLKNNTVLVYSVVKSGECLLQELKQGKKGEYEFVTVEEFPELPLSTSPERIEEVIEYVKDNYNYQKYGLVLWSHATGWIPWFAGSTPEPLEDHRKAFGEDIYQGGTYKTNITSLAEAIPNGMFDFIWFDCCYMANIETVFQLREKTDFIVGSVMEIAADGMPYDITMPFLLRKEADLESAAAAFFNYYNEDFIAVSVSIMDVSALYYLAETSKIIFETGTGPTSLTSIQTYQRNLSEKFYDMGQLLMSYEGISEESKMELKDAFADAVIYKKISYYDFNNKPINTKDYSGLSMHNFINNGSANNEYYMTIDWYKATR